MNAARTHRRLVLLMAGVALAAFSAGAGVQPVAAGVGFLGLGLAFLREPGPRLAHWVARVRGPLALLLTLQVGYTVALGGRDVVTPVIHLLLLLLLSEALRPAEALSEGRLYALSLALLLAATAYRPGVLFGLALTAYVALAAVAVPLGVVRRQAQRYAPSGPVPWGGFHRSAAVLAVVPLLSAALVFLTFPRVGQGWGGRG
ncbi:MAG: hypothetical protein RQ751_04420, partial [Longimicrobiales bacterium]|nr:hypothetical protein [Longimicrobiales bacterium]